MSSCERIKRADRKLTAMQSHERLELGFLVRRTVIFSQEVVEELGDGPGDRELDIHLRTCELDSPFANRERTRTRASTKGVQMAPIRRP